MANWQGWAGKILNIDLTNGKIEKEPLAEELAFKHIGGRGFGTKVLYDEVGPDVDPLGPDNVLTITFGPLSGTLAPSNARSEMVSKSPFTGIYGHTNWGGFFGPEVKWAGYDAIVIRGQSEKPVYLWINDDHVELKDAAHLWGKDTWLTQRIIRAELHDENIKTLKIGPAGENLCFSACVLGDIGRAAGRCGFGTIWGAKKLKAIAVRGTKGVNIARPKELIRLTKEYWSRAKQDPMYATHVKYGTTGWVGGDYIRGAGALGKELAGAEESGFDALYDRNLSCFGCALHCGHYYTVKSGKYQGTAGEGIEGNVQTFLAIRTHVGDPAFLCYYNNLCNQLGVNLDHPGAAIAWAMEMYQDGVITKEDTGGIELTWGNQDAIATLVKQMAYKQGFGEILDAYPIRATQMLGKGSELYANYTKGYFGKGSGIVATAEYTLAYSVATRGHDHLTGCPSINTPNFRQQMTNELLEKMGRERYNDSKVFTQPFAANPKKAQRLFDIENIFALADMAGACKFPAQQCFYVAGLEMADFSRFLAATTGVEFSEADLVKAAEVEFTLERAFNARHGIRRIDDYPYVFHWQLKHGKPHPRFDYSSLKLSLADYDLLLDEYYRLRGCDLKTGIPTWEKLQALGLDYVADDLYPAVK